jgi:sn-glycerol 3-phosphate transport system permease protein
VSVSCHWNNFLWPMIVTSSVEARPLTVGLKVFTSGDQGIDWSITCAVAAAVRLPVVPASVHAECHARGDKVARLVPVTAG